MGIVELEDQDADQLLVVVDYLRKKVKEEEEEDGVEYTLVPLLKGLLKHLIEDRLGESYEDISPTPLIPYSEELAEDTTDSLLDEFDF